MPEEEDRQPRVLLLGEPGDGAQVLDDGVPAVAVGEVAVVGVAGGLAVTAVVVGVDGVPGGGQRLGEPGVAAGVLGHAVGDLHDRLGLPVGEPPVGVEGDAVARRHRRRRALHGRRLWLPVGMPGTACHAGPRRRQVGPVRVGTGAMPPVLTRTRPWSVADAGSHMPGSSMNRWVEIVPPAAVCGCP